MTIQLTRAQGEKLLASIKGRATKYRNQKVKGYDADGNVITFDSKREARRWGELQALEKQGVITYLVRQVPFKFALDGRELKYKSGRAVRYGMFVWHVMHFCVRVQFTPTPSRYSAAFAAENSLAKGSVSFVGAGFGKSPTGTVFKEGNCDRVKDSRTANINEPPE